MRPKIVAIRFCENGETEMLAAWIDEKTGIAWLAGLKSQEEEIRRIAGAIVAEEETAGGKFHAGIAAGGWGGLIAELRAKGFTIEGGVRSFRRMAH